MGAPIHDWPSMLPRINELRRKGWSGLKIAAEIGVPAASYNSGMRAIKKMGLHLADIIRDGETPAIVSPALTLKRVIALIPRGLSCTKMAAEIGCKPHVVEHVLAKKLTPGQRSAWEAAKKDRASMFKRKTQFAKTATRIKDPQQRHEACVADAKEVAATFQPARRRMGEGHPAMAPGGLAWAAIWDGNPPPYPHDMMKGRFC